MAHCGADSDSCCTSIEIPGGTYFRTYDTIGTDGGVEVAADGGATGLADPATVSGFRLDKYLVTVGRFRQFVSAWGNGSGYLPPSGSGKHAHLNGGKGLTNSAVPGTYETGWIASDDDRIAPTNANLGCDSPFQTWSILPSSDENLPINCVNWYEAYAFCIWDGGFLPSEAEWEYAAAGGSAQRRYPWGSAQPGVACPGSGCNVAIFGCYYPNGTGTCTGMTNIGSVGSATLGAGLWGQLDLAGNVWEWNLDWYATYVNPCTDCAYLTINSSQVFRGGCFDNPVQYLTPSFRNSDTPTPRRGGVGFRCARSP